MIHQLLIERTKAVHQQLEDVLYARESSKNGLSYHRYRNLISVQAAFHQNLAAQVDNRSDFPTWLIERQQQRADWLRHDASALSCQLVDVAMLYETKYHLLGGLYVAEGSVLGARILEKEFRSNEWLGGVSHCFYERSAQLPTSTWRDFLAYLVQNSAHQEECIADGACSAFRYLITMADYVNAVV